MDDKNKYNNALERARDYYKANLTLNKADENAVLEDIFPELKESEDEKIRKRIIHALHGDVLDMEETTKALAWLEKQGEKPQGKTALEASKEEKFDNANKVEPKFKVGDWLCENEPNNYARFIQILEIVNVLGKERYRISRDFHNDEDIVEFDFAEKYYHKFGIADAKDGDVLYSLDSKQPFIFKHRKKHEQAEVYCGINIYGKFFVGNTKDCIITTDKYIPATKEQRDKLLKAMTDKGWQFNFEKKELKELKKIEQNSAWSEDDERIRKTSISFLKHYADKGYENAVECIDWLESLKDRIGG